MIPHLLLEREAVILSTIPSISFVFENQIYQPDFIST
jgi:hypothetical protein